MTTQEQLDKLNQEISVIEGGAQEYQIGTRKLRRPELALLYKERRILQQQINEESGGGTYVATFDRR